MTWHMKKTAESRENHCCCHYHEQKFYANWRRLVLAHVCCSVRKKCAPCMNAIPNAKIAVGSNMRPNICYRLDKLY